MHSHSRLRSSLTRSSIGGQRFICERLGFSSSINVSLNRYGFSRLLNRKLISSRYADMCLIESWWNVPMWIPRALQSPSHQIKRNPRWLRCLREDRKPSCGTCETIGPCLNWTSPPFGPSSRPDAGRSAPAWETWRIRLPWFRFLLLATMRQS